MRVFAVALGALLLTTTANATEAPLTWDRVFSAKGAPAAVELHATYFDASDKPHTLVQWRLGDEHLRRDSDDALSIVVAKRGDEYGYQVVDRKSGAAMQVSRTNLYRLGVFSDWSSLATNMRRPVAPHRITARNVVATKLGACRLYRIEVEKSAPRDVCWSSEWHVPFFVEQAGHRELTMESLTKTVDENVFVTNGAMVFDADREIAGDD